MPPRRGFECRLRNHRRCNRAGCRWEAIANVVVGFAVALLTQIAVFPIFGLQVSLPENLAIGLLFTTVSIARSHALRRLF